MLQHKPPRPRPKVGDLWQWRAPSPVSPLGLRAEWCPTQIWVILEISGDTATLLYVEGIRWATKVVSIRSHFLGSSWVARGLHLLSRAGKQQTK